MFEISQSRRQYAAAAPLLALVLALAIAGCTSDETNPVGAGVPGELQVGSPETVALFEMTDRGHVELTGEDTLYSENQVVYFGGSATESSAILARYDFSVLRDSVPEWMTLTEGDILAATLNLYRLNFYAAEDEDEEEEETREGYDKNFEVYNLAGPLDVSLYPGPEPAYEELLIDQMSYGTNIYLDFNPATIIDWLENGHDGIIIREGPASDFAGLVGFASVDLDLDGGGVFEIARSDTAITVGQAISVQIFATRGEGEDVQTFERTFAIPPVEDVSTLHPLEAPSADLSSDVMLRTHRRISPYFAFAVADSLPDGAFINRAVIRLGADFERSYGQIQSLVIHEVPLDLVDGAASVSLADLEESGAVSTGQYAVDLDGLESAEGEWVGWDVTSAVQRIINGVLAEDTVFLITAGEDFTGFATTSYYDPDFYLSRYVFHGTEHPLLLPHLEVTYTPFSGGVR